MYPHSCRLIFEYGRITRVGRFLDKLQRLIRRRLEIVRWHELACLLLQRHEAGMRIGTIEFTAWCKHGCNDSRPFRHIRQPAEGSPSRENEIIRTGCEMRSLLYGSLNEVCL